MPRKVSKLQVVAGKRAIAPAGAARKSAPPRATQTASNNGQSPLAPPQVPGRWLLLAISGSLAVAALCAWGALCLLFWQGNWQLLYHPASAITRTPAAGGVAYDSIGFATTPTGVPRLSGWWIPAASPQPLSRYTVLYFHGKDGNLSNAVGEIAQLHSAGVNVFAFDYRGYGQSQFAHPSEKLWREDASWAFQYLAATRQIDPHTLVVAGSGLGANLALEFAAAHPELAGVVAESPLEDATSAIFDDARARMVPAHWLVDDRWDLAAPAAALRIPSLWFLPFPVQPANGGPAQNPPFFDKVTAPKMFVWLPPGQASTVSFSDEFARWLGSLNHASPQPAPPTTAPPTSRSTRRTSRRHRAPAA
jgi:uncharacterized protein